MNLSRKEKQRIKNEIDRFDRERIMEIRNLIHYGISEKAIKTMGYKDDEIQEAVSSRFI